MVSLISPNLDTLCYYLHRRTQWLDNNILIIGAAQTGKSTLANAIAETLYYYKGRSFNLNFVDNNIAFNARQGIGLFKKLENDVMNADEAYFFADRREVMGFIQVKYLQILNFLASKRNTVITAMQDYTDIDSRIVKKTDVLILVTGIGHAAVYAGSKKFPIIKRQILNTDRFVKKPGLLSDQLGDHEIRKDANYIFDIEWGGRKDAWWDHYMQVKEKWQGKTLDNIDKRLERMETAEVRTDAKELAQKRIEVKQGYSREELEKEGLI